jgi:hypothetical protein
VSEAALRQIFSQYFGFPFQSFHRLLKTHHHHHHHHHRRRRRRHPVLVE